MMPDDVRKRVEEELGELQTKFEKLGIYLNNLPEEKNLYITKSNYYLNQQYHIMEEYIYILDRRLRLDDEERRN